MGCKALNFKLAIHFNDISIARTGNFTMYAFGPFSRKRSHILLLTCIYACVTFLLRVLEILQCMRSVPFRGNDRIYYYLHVSMHVFIETHAKLIVDWHARVWKVS